MEETSDPGSASPPNGSDATNGAPMPDDSPHSPSQNGPNSTTGQNGEAPAGQPDRESAPGGGGGSAPRPGQTSNSRRENHNTSQSQPSPGNRRPNHGARVPTWVSEGESSLIADTEMSERDLARQKMARMAQFFKDIVPKPNLKDIHAKRGNAIKECAWYYIRVRRVEKVMLGLMKMGETETVTGREDRELCSVCDKLHLNREKFIVRPRGPTERDRHDKERAERDRAAREGNAVRIDFDAGTGSGNRYLGNMLNIAARASYCPLCRLVVNALSEQEGFETWLHPRAFAQERLKPDEQTRLTGIKCFVRWEIDGRAPRKGSSGAQVKLPLQGWTPARTRRLRLDWSDETLTPAYLVLLARPAEYKTNEEAAFLGQHVATRTTSHALIGRWLKDCLEHHDETCRRNMPLSKKELSHSFFSVIDVAEKRLTKLPEDTEAEYVAMSYTWGGAQFYNLTMSDVENMKKRTAFDTLDTGLPKTFVDAMALVSSMNYKYLWVDALCIIQDSTSSWDRNVEIMDRIYGNAVFTICAADGTNPRAGLVAMNSAQRTYSQKIEMVADKVHLMVAYPAEAYIQKSTWNTRAWTFQERLLSRRCVIFVDGRVFFQCRSAMQREDILTEDVRGWSIEHHETPLKTLGDIAKRPLNVYMECVKLYTKRHLTWSKDMLNAFSGVGNYISHVFGKEGMLFGLPKTHFDFALLWQMVPHEDNQYRGKQRPKLQHRSLKTRFDEIIAHDTNQSLGLSSEDFGLLRQLLNKVSEAEREEQKAARQRLKNELNGPVPAMDRSFREYQKSDVEDMPFLFPTWSWCGWANSYSMYYPDMVSGVVSNVHDWLYNRTWITWYVRDQQGKLKLVWQQDQDRLDEEERDPILKERRWIGYHRSNRECCQTSFSERDKLGRPIEAHWPDSLRRDFQKTLNEFSFNISYHDHATGSELAELKYLQFWTWSAWFRLKIMENPIIDNPKSKEMRFAILDYKDDICGVITPDRYSWTYGKNEQGEPTSVVLEPGEESTLEFIAISEAKEFSRDECAGWRTYVQHEGQDWDLFYVLLVAEVKGVHHRFGLGKVMKDSFADSSRHDPEWKEIILG